MHARIRSCTLLSLMYSCYYAQSPTLQIFCTSGGYHQTVIYSSIDRETTRWWRAQNFCLSLPHGWYGNIYPSYQSSFGVWNVRTNNIHNGCSNHQPEHSIQHLHSATPERKQKRLKEGEMAQTEWWPAESEGSPHCKPAQISMSYWRIRCLHLADYTTHREHGLYSA